MSANLYTVQGILDFLKPGLGQVVDPNYLENQWKHLLIVHPHCSITSYAKFQEERRSRDDSLLPDFISHLFNIQTSSRLLQFLRTNDQAAIAREFKTGDAYYCPIRGSEIHMNLMEYAERTRDELVEIIALLDASQKLTIIFNEPPHLDVILEPVLQAIAKTQAAGRFGLSFSASPVDGDPSFGPSETEYQQILTLIESGHLYGFRDHINRMDLPFRDFTRLMAAIGSPAAPKGFRLELRVVEEDIVDNEDLEIQDHPSENLLISLTMMIRLGQCPSNLHLSLEGPSEISQRTWNGFVEALSMDRSEPRLHLTLKDSIYVDHLFSALFNRRLNRRLDSTQLASLNLKKCSLRARALGYGSDPTFLQACPDHFNLDLSQNAINFNELQRLLNDLNNPGAPKHLTLNLNETTGLSDPNVPSELVTLLASPDLPLGLRLKLHRSGQAYWQLIMSQYKAIVQSADLENSPPGFQLTLSASTNHQWEEKTPVGNAVQRNTNAHATAALSVFTFLCCQARLKREGQTHFPRDVQNLIIFLSLPNWWHRSNKAPRTYAETIKTLSFFTPKKEVAKLVGSESEQGREKRLKPAEDLSFPG